MRGKEGGGNETHKERKAFNSRNKGRDIRPKKMRGKIRKKSQAIKRKRKGGMQAKADEEGKVLRKE